MHTIGVGWQVIRFLHIQPASGIPLWLTIPCPHCTGPFITFMISAAHHTTAARGLTHAQGIIQHIRKLQGDKLKVK